MYCMNGIADNRDNMLSDTNSLITSKMFFSLFEIFKKNRKALTIIKQI